MGWLSTSSRLAGHSGVRPVRSITSTRTFLKTALRAWSWAVMKCNHVIKSTGNRFMDMNSIDPEVFGWFGGRASWFLICLNTHWAKTGLITALWHGHYHRTSYHDPSPSFESFFVIVVVINYQLHHYQLHHLQSYSPEQDMATSYLYSWAILWLCVDKVGGTSWDRLSVNIVCSEKSSAEFNLGEDMTLHRRAFLVEWFHVTPTEPCWKYLVEWAYNHVSWAI